MDGQAIAVIALIVGTLWWYNKTKISPENQKSIPERGDGTRKEITVQSELRSCLSHTPTWLQAMFNQF